MWTHPTMLHERQIQRNTFISLRCCEINCQYFGVCFWMNKCNSFLLNKQNSKWYAWSVPIGMLQSISCNKQHVCVLDLFILAVYTHNHCCTHLLIMISIQTKLTHTFFYIPPILLLSINTILFSSSIALSWI